MGRAFEYRKATKLKRWGHMAKTFTRLGKQIAIAVKAGGPEPENNPTLRSVIATCKRENMPKDNIERAIKNAMGKDQSDYKGMTYEGYGPHGVAVFVDTLTDNPTRTVADVRSVFNPAPHGSQGSETHRFPHIPYRSRSGCHRTVSKACRTLPQYPSGSSVLSFSDWNAPGHPRIREPPSHVPFLRSALPC